MVIQEKSIKVHMFWAYGDLSLLERLAAASFAANGFDLQFWTYGSIKNLPEGIEQFDAREIIPEVRVFTYKNGSYAGFANLFRYAVLSQQGGLWADTDVVCLTSVDEFKVMASKDGFLVTERARNSIQINNNLIYHPNPLPGDIIDLALAIADRFPVDKLKWGDCGPKLLNTLVKAYPDLTPAVMPPEFANHINWWDCPQSLLDPSIDLPKNASFLHCFNEMWRRSNMDKNISYPQKSVLGTAFSKFENRL